ncbi:von Willebrand factor A domain-containing protein 8 [Phytophthora pseudosyringae]|uniref:von Willebrand factor A domain-containing protein 8 n=1 Tax=Phytophthora pseudosyringae TaxID=221518 RepID=A0A8T1V368_9STRA|nr:von Willebrand factor A domain-containing protein 8 [Phytophthora pseudosyringae]
MALYPPNSQALSDDVIGDVLGRARAPQRRTVRDFNGCSIAPPESPSQPQVSSHASKTRNPVQPQVSTRNSKRVSGRKRSSAPLSAEDLASLVAASIDGTDPAGGELRPSYLAKLARVSDALYRERRRLHQARYRKKQQESTLILEEDVQKLREEIRSLTLRRQNADMGISTSLDIWGVATEYFRLFRNGFRSPPEAVNTFALEFLRKSMASDVVSGLMCGPEAILQNWKLFSMCFDDVCVDLERLDKGATSTILVAIATTSVTISKETLRLLFPHLYSGEQRADGKQLSELAKKLQGQRFAMRGSVEFEWDPVTDSVVRVHGQSDMLTPMLRVLGTLEDVSRVFEGALVTPECRLVTRFPTNTIG